MHGLGKKESDWIVTQRARVEEYLRREGIEHAGVAEYPTFHVHPRLALWAVQSKKSPERKGWWAISGDVPTEHIGWDKGRNPREALRAFSTQWAEASANMLRGKETPGYSIGTHEEWPTLGELLQRRARTLRKYVENDSIWEEESL
jgi:Domain of unknown function (DUF4826)